MSKQPRQPYGGCSVDADAKGNLRLRWRWYDADGQPTHRAYVTGLPDSPENRATLESFPRTVGAFVKRGKDPTPTLNEYFGRAPSGARDGSAALITLATYVRDIFLPYNRPRRCGRRRRATVRAYVAAVPA